MIYLNGPVLGIETSCDETSAAVILGKNVCSNVVSSQADLHLRWGGIVPEVAARKHAEALLPTISEALALAGCDLNEIAGIAVTNRPGLVGALSVGVTGAKALSWALDRPLIAVNHLEGHVLSSIIENNVPAPHICLLVSGGHTELIEVIKPGEYNQIGRTIDDAAGEAFDKAARVLGLGYPGGPAIERAARHGESNKYSLPRGLQDPTCDFSFAGLKTAIRNLAETEAERLDVHAAAAAFQETIVGVLVDRTIYACRERGCLAVTLVGGVAANSRLREHLAWKCQEYGLALYVPSFELCTDNAAMIAHVGSWRLAKGERSGADVDVDAVSLLSSGGNP
jgi:N6-L-threonylcarbamoyladenine synthase